LASKKQARAERERSPRKARICTECHARNFGNLDWECDRHPGKTVDQPDQPYFGRIPKLAAPPESPPEEG
jgi:hypothetical protein